MLARFTKPGTGIFEQEALGLRIRPWSLGDTFAAPGDNFLALKVTYWIGM